MVLLFFAAMSKRKSNNDFKTRIKGQKSSAKDSNKTMRDGCLVIGIIMIILGTSILFTFMDDDSWAENSIVRQRILLIACFLFISSTGLCLYVMKTDRKQQREELELLVIEKPPSYDSIVLSEPPPAYVAVVKSIHIIQQETTG